MRLRDRLERCQLELADVTSALETTEERVLNSLCAECAAPLGNCRLRCERCAALAEPAGKGEG